MAELKDNYTHINGWGIDADPENEPTYPMKNYTGDDHKRLDYERSAQQPVNVEVLTSNERPGITRVFGAATPPSGLSGAIRRFAFKFSESEYGHWLPLLIADRVNMVEGLIDDLRHGHVPNILAEKGWKAEWKYNRKAAVQKVAIAGIVTLGIIAFFADRRRRRNID